MKYVLYDDLLNKVNTSNASPYIKEWFIKFINECDIYSDDGLIDVHAIVEVPEDLRNSYIPEKIIQAELSHNLSEIIMNEIVTGNRIKITEEKDDIRGTLKYRADSVVLFTK